MQTEKGRLVAQTAFPDPTTAPHWRAISGPANRGPISRPCPTRVPLLIGSVAICCPNRRDGLPSPQDDNIKRRPREERNNALSVVPITPVVHNGSAKMARVFPVVSRAAGRLFGASI